MKTCQQRKLDKIFRNKLKNELDLRLVDLAIFHLDVRANIGNSIVKKYSG